MCHAAYRLEKILGHLPFSRKFYSTREEGLQAAIIVACATTFYYHMFLLHTSIGWPYHDRLNILISINFLFSPYYSFYFFLVFKFV